MPKPPPRATRRDLATAGILAAAPLPGPRGEGPPTGFEYPRHRIGAVDFATDPLAGLVD